MVEGIRIPSTLQGGMLMPDIATEQKTTALELALAMVQHGWYVVPFDARKKPFTPHGKDDASNVEGQVQIWWYNAPYALVGINLERSGLICLDVDRHRPSEDGVKTLELLVQELGGGIALNTVTGPISRSPSGGLHYFYKRPEGIELKNSKPGVGLDLLSHAVAFAGAGYSWLDGHEWDTPLTDLPAWLLELAKPGKRNRQATDATKYDTKVITEDEIQRARDALARLSPTRCDDYQGGAWLNVGMSLYELGDVGLRLWDEWSQGSAKYEEGACAEKWESFHPAAGPDDITMGSLIAWAREDNPEGEIYDKLISQLRDEDEESTPAPRRSMAECPPLPEAARVDPALGVDACKWLDDYIAFSREWSPRGYDDFHEAIGLWTLSTIAGRRVLVNFGKQRYGNLYIALTARTSLWAKTSTAEIAKQVLYTAGLSGLLAADSATPQKFVADLTSRIDSSYDDLSDERKEYRRLKLALAGQRGWYYEEFGQHIASMMRENGTMSDFRGLLRALDDTPPSYEYTSIGRGSDYVERPYLALLANMTPDDLRPHAKRGSGLWGDGFLARFALITPPDGELSQERFPRGERIIPVDLSMPLMAWHKRLRVPEVTITDIPNEEGKPKGRKSVAVDPLLPEVLALDEDVREAFYAYFDALQAIIKDSQVKDIEGNYTRFPEKALRISLLLASMSEMNKITIRHWARALDITERWRAGLHELYRQLNEQQPSELHTIEDRVLRVFYRRGGTATHREVCQYADLSSAEAKAIVAPLIDEGVLRMLEGKPKRYEIIKSVEM